MPTPYLSRINYYPFKSLDGQNVEQARLLPCGAIEHDRRFAIFDAVGQLINGKRMPAVHRLACEYDPVRRWLVLRERPGGIAASFFLDRQRDELQRWLGDYFGLQAPVEIQEYAEGGLPDDTDAPGPTVIAEATLEAVAAWFPGLTVEEVRARFRPNLEIGGVVPFFEDQLYAAEDEAVDFAIGDARLSGTNPCQRCVVPSRWSLTGEVGPESDFARRFADLRRQHLPRWAEESRFDHFYRLAVNTCPTTRQECMIRVGDELRILGKRKRS